MRQTLVEATIRELSREKRIDKDILEIDNKIDALGFKRRVLLSNKGYCMRCGEKKELPPVLNGVCSDCEMSDFPRG